MTKHTRRGWLGLTSGACVIALGAGLLHERLSPRAFVGMAVIALGLLLIDGRPLRWLRRRLGGG